MSKFQKAIIALAISFLIITSPILPMIITSANDEISDETIVEETDSSEEVISFELYQDETVDEYLIEDVTIEEVYEESVCLDEESFISDFVVKEQSSENRIVVVNSTDEYLYVLSNMAVEYKLIVNANEDLNCLYPECGVYYDGTYVLGYSDSDFYNVAIEYCINNGYVFSADGEVSICSNEDIDEPEGTVNFGSTKKIAVIDTGSNVCNEAYSVIGENATDVNGHGTSMCNLILSLAPNAYVISIKAIGDNGKGDVSDVYAALQLAKDSDVDVILMAISIRDYGQYEALRSLVKEIIDSGITVIASAGNNNSLASAYIPGGIEGVLTIGSIDIDGYKTATSNWGECVNYYEVAGTTSEAAAIFAGRFISDNYFDVASSYMVYIPTSDSEDSSSLDIDVSDLEFITNGSNGTPYMKWLFTSDLQPLGYKNESQFADAIISNCLKMEGAAYSQSVQGKVDCITYVNLAYAATLGQISNLRIENGQIKFDGSVSGGPFNLYTSTGATSCTYWSSFAPHNIGTGGVPFVNYSLLQTLQKYNAKAGDIVLFGKYNTVYRGKITTKVGGVSYTKWFNSITEVESATKSIMTLNPGGSLTIETGEGSNFDWTHAAIYSGSGTRFYEALSSSLPAGLYTISDTPSLVGEKGFNRIAILSYEVNISVHDEVSSPIEIIKMCEDNLINARGASFEILNSSMNSVGSLLDKTNNGNYTTTSPLVIGSWDTSSPTPVSAHYYFRETSPATEYWNGSAWVPCNFEMDANLYSLWLLYDPTTDVLRYSISIGDDSNIEFIINDAQIANYRANGGVENPTIPTFTLTNQRLGAVVVEKVDIGSNVLQDAEFTVYLDSTCTNVFGKLSYNPATYMYELGNLPFGIYYLKETKAPDGFVIDPNVYPFLISSNNLCAKISNLLWDVLGVMRIQGKFVNLPYGSVSVYKVNVSGDDLSGAAFEVYMDTSATVKIGELIYDETTAKYTLGGLGLGTYYLKETKAPPGYFIDPNIYAFTINGDNLNAVVSNFSWDILGDAGKEGKFVNIGPGSVSVKKVNPNGTELLGAIFTVYEDSTCTSPVGNLVYNNATKLYTLGGLNMGTYYLKETKSPPGYYIDPNCYEFKIEPINKDRIVSNISWSVVSEANLTDMFVNINPVLGTTLIDSQTKAHIGVVCENATVVDTVKYRNLISGESYSVVGELFVLDGLENKVPLLTNSGTPVKKEVVFEVSDTTGEVKVEFSIDSTGLSGKTIFCEESLYKDGQLIGGHWEIVESQMVKYPDVKTMFCDNDLGLSHDSTAYGVTTLIDNVWVGNLTSGSYELKGTIHYKSNGEALLDSDGNMMVATTKFVVDDSSDKDVLVTFRDVDVTGLGGESLVCFESLYKDGIELVNHADLSNKNQTVEVPLIGTTLTEPITNSHKAYYAPKCVLEDTIFYSGLTIGMEYEAVGTLYDVDTGDVVLDKEGNPICSEAVKFIPTENTGSVIVTFTFDSEIFIGKISKVVAFEDVFEVEGYRRVATHADLTDTNQQVQFPTIATLATVDNNKVFTPNETAVLMDVITYTGLIEGRTYRYETKLMNADGSEFLVNGEPLNITGEFVPTNSDGEVAVVFTFDAHLLSDDTKLVVFEYLYDSETNMLILKHCDLNSESQTVTCRRIVTTGENAGPALARTLIGGTMGSIGIVMLGALVIRKRNDRK